MKLQAFLYYPYQWSLGMCLSFSIIEASQTSLVYAVVRYVISLLAYNSLSISQYIPRRSYNVVSGRSKNDLKVQNFKFII